LEHWEVNRGVYLRLCALRYQKMGEEMRGNGGAVSRTLVTMKMIVPRKEESEGKDGVM
jgi:hypothetical protein